MDNSTLSLSVPADADGDRLDRFLTPRVGDHSRSQIARWIRDGRATVDGRVARASTTVREGQIVELDVPPPAPTVLVPEPIELEVVYEDADVVVLDKPAGLVVHPGSGRDTGTLVHGLLHRYGVLSPLGAPVRPGIVHRLDAGTSGLMVVARTERAHLSLAKQFSDHSTGRVYVALVWDHGLPDAGTISTPYGRHTRDRKKFSGRVISGKQAVTHYEVTDRRAGTARVELRLETGRTHQIRVHLSEAGHPLVGDPTYGRRRRIERPVALRMLGFELGLARAALHARHLAFDHPVTGERVAFDAPVPLDLQTVFEVMRAATEGSEP